jgi:hypothetical protein
MPCSRARRRRGSRRPASADCKKGDNGSTASRKDKENAPPNCFAVIVAKVIICFAPRGRKPPCRRTRCLADRAARRAHPRPCGPRRPSAPCGVAPDEAMSCSASFPLRDASMASRRRVELIDGFAGFAWPQAVKRLLADIRASKVDVIVVYLCVYRTFPIRKPATSSLRSLQASLASLNEPKMPALCGTGRFLPEATIAFTSSGQRTPSATILDAEAMAPGRR